jgi:hypothetical protein
MDTFKTCRRRWFLQYYLKLRRKYQAPRIAADTGSAVHDALHTFYVLGGVHNYDDALEAALNALELRRDSDLARVAGDDQGTKDTEEIHEVAAIVAEGYFEWLIETGADDHWRVEGTEEKLQVIGPLDTEIKGYVDLRGTHIPSGDLLVVDTKVVASIDDTIKTLHMNEQGPLYAALLKMAEPDNDRGFRVVWNMLKRNKHSAKAKPPLYQRYELAINPDMLRQFYAQLHGQIQDMLTLEGRLNDGEAHHIVAYPTPTRDCSWKCPYFSLCGAMNDPRNDVDWIIQNNYEVELERID